MEWILSHKAETVAALLCLLRLIEAIIALTPSQKDDKILSQVKAVVNNFFKIGW